jgi:ABC-2 type transport system permease protein
MAMVKEVAFREIRTRARTKSFKWITGFLVVAAVAGPVIATLIPDNVTEELREVTIGLAGVDPNVAGRIGPFAEGGLDVTFRDLSGLSTAEVERTLSDADVDLVLEPGPTFVWNRSTDYELAAVVYAVLQQEELLAKGRALGLGQADIAELLTPPAVEQRFADEADASEGVTIFVSFLGLMAAFMLPQIFGQLTLMSVVEEKSTRVIEVLLNHLRPRTLLMGKILGVGALAVLQLVVVVGGLTAALLLTDFVQIPPSVWRFVPVILVSILGGLAIYNTLFALLGSLISRQEDASQVMMPVFVPLMAGFFIGQTAITGNAESVLVKILTYFPLTTPMLLPLRVARDAIAPWEVALSLVLLAFGVWLLVRIAGRVYEFTLLHTGSRIGWGQLVRLSRGATLD